MTAYAPRGYHRPHERARGAGVAAGAGSRALLPVRVPVALPVGLCADVDDAPGVWAMPGPRSGRGRRPVDELLVADVRRTMGETRRLAEEVAAAKADLERLEEQVAAVRVTVRSLEARLERRPGPPR